MMLKNYRQADDLSMCVTRIFCVVMLITSTVHAWTQSDDRPLRSVPSESHSSIPYSLLPTPYSLLTAQNLEQPLTQYYITQYSSRGGIAWLNTIINRGSVYIPFIREEITRRKLPPELLYLPVIESGYLPSAKSKSGAVGLWQFMMNSIGPFNIKVNADMDERRDFQKATRAALQKLEENYRFFGNWPLALAAYNAGLGGVNRTVQRTGVRDYWKLCEKKELSNETIHYVPKLIAASWILSQPRRFGIDNWPEYIKWDSIPVGKQVSLEALAAEAEVDPALLRQGNMELLYGLTPRDSAYRLKVPAQTATRITEVLKRDDFKSLNHYRYVIKYGDTLSALSRHYGVSLQHIEQSNPGISNRYLKIGETVAIPALKGVEPYQGKQTGKKSDELSFEGIHLVKRGETLWSLAIGYSVDPEALAQANGMELNQILSEGKVLKVPIIEW